jgi:hypothetical protein
MPEPFADTLATLAAGRSVLVARLRTLAARVEQLPLDAAAEVLLLLEPTVAAFEREAALALERAPGAPAVHKGCDRGSEPAAGSEPQREHNSNKGGDRGHHDER